MTTAEDLTDLELLVLWEAGGDNTIGVAYSAVERHAGLATQRESIVATEAALLRLLDLGLLRFVEAFDDIGYTAKRFELPVMTRQELAEVLGDGSPRVTGSQA
jgi:hypothetical protein